MEQAIPILPADVLNVAREFYIEGLGFEILYEASADGKTGILALKRGGIRLTLDAPMAGHGRGACVALEVHDADACYKEWQLKIKIRKPPVNEEWGGRTFDVKDPFENTIFVIGPKTLDTVRS